MSKLLMLGTGNGGTQKLYNTSFVIQNEQGNFLIDTGGSVEVVERLKHFNIDLKDLKNIFISHSHIDHIMGLIWIFKKLGRYIKEGSIKDKINIYGNDEVIFAIKSVANLVLPEKLVKIVFDIINFCPLKDGDSILINDIKYNFFDIKAKGVKQFGFDCIIDERKLVFLGDETFNLELAWRVRDAFFVMHEAFCLDSEENIFHAYEKNHSTVKKACLMMDELNVKCLILYHTEESHSINKKKLYLEEGKQYFHKILLVPNDLDIIDLSMIDKVGGVILKDKKILVQRKKNNRVECIIPGGKREKNETDFETLKRELMEEISVNLVSIDYLGGYDDIAVFSNQPLHVETYIAEIEGEIICNNEIKEAVWIDRNYEKMGIKVGSILGEYVIPELIKRDMM